MSDIVVHVAGPPAAYDGRLRQRCVWCGAAIIDTDLEDEEAAARGCESVWTPGCLVAVDPDAHRYAIMPPPCGIPAGFCAAIDPAITG